jgi:hypothetical protein
MNKIIIWEPRWHDRVVLVADRKIGEHNEITIKHRDFPNPFYITGKTARTFPLEEMATKRGGLLAVRAIPLRELEKEVISL